MAPIPQGSLVFNRFGTFVWTDPSGNELTPPPNSPADTNLGTSVGNLVSRASDGAYLMATNVGMPIVTDWVAKAFSGAIAALFVRNGGSPLGSPNCAVDAAGRFYVAHYSGQTAVVERCDDAGTITATWSFPAVLAGIESFAVSPAGDSAFVAGFRGADNMTGPVYRFNFGSGTLAAFVTEQNCSVDNACGASIAVQQNGHVLVAWQNNNTPNYFVKEYDPAGAAQATYPLASGSFADFTVALSAGLDATTFWVSHYLHALDVVRVENIRNSDGAVLHNFDKPDVAGDWANAPFCVVRAVAAPTLLDVSFSAGRDLMVDGTEQLYGAPHWQGSTGRAYPYLIKDLTKLRASAATWVAGFSGQVHLRGTVSNGMTVPATLAALRSGTSDVYEIVAVEFSSAFPAGTAFLNPLTIAWEASLDGGVTWLSVGASSNPLYVSLSTAGPTNPFRTVAHLACSDGGATTPTAAAQRTWGLFSNGGTAPTNVKTWDGQKALHYYKPGTSFDLAVNPITVAGLLAVGSSECVAWALMLKDCWAINGVPSNYKFIRVKPSVGQLFWVKDWNKTSNIFSFQSDQPDMQPPPPDGTYGHYDRPGGNKFENLRTAPGQNSGTVPQPLTGAPSQKAFGNHQFLELAGTYYDPSYGLTYASEADFQSHLDGYGSVRDITSGRLRFNFKPMGGTVVMEFYTP